MNLSIYGLRRSGNHAIIAWLMKNMSNGSELFQVNHPIILAKNVCFINDITDCFKHDINKLRINTMFARANFQNTIISYEDISLRTTTEFTAGMPKVVVVRDIKNVIASRLKNLKRYSECKNTQKLLQVNERIANIWTEHATAVAEKKVIGIIFERWVSSKEYRDSVAQILGTKNLDITDTILPYGGGSSFTGITSQPPSAKSLNDRHLQMELDKSSSKIIEREDISVLRSALGFAA